MRNKANTELNEIDLRYMQIEISLDSGAVLPGMALIKSFQKWEFISLIEKTSKGMICFLKLEFDDPQILTQRHEAFEILEIKYQSPNSAFVKVIANGPLALIFCEMEEVWWVNPTFMHSAGMTLTIRGTKNALRSIRTKLAKLIGTGFTVKLGTESLDGPDFIDLLPERQRIVLDKAIEMGYYSRPRGCTQRDIAQAMNIKQATVSEHLQSAESKIIHSISN